MADELAGAVAPEAPVTNAPAATNAVEAAPTGQEQPESVTQPERTYSEQDMRKVVADRLKKEQRRIERAVRAEVERDLLRQQLEARDKPKQEAAPSSEEPKPENFKDWESYNRALIRYEAAQIAAKSQEESRAEAQRREAQQSEAQLARSIQDNFKAAAEKYSDFHEVVTQEGLPFYKGSPILAYVAKSKVGGEIAYHLGNDPAEAQRIDSMHPIDQVLALNALETKLTTPQASKAPAPIVPSGTQAGVRKDWTDMGTAEHVNAWLNRKRKR